MLISLIMQVVYNMGVEAVHLTTVVYWGSTLVIWCH